MTIEDLNKASEEDIEEIRSSIDFVSDLRSFIWESGNKEGMTLKEYKDFLVNRQPKDCETCRGTGEVMPRARSVGTIHASSAHKCRAALYYDITGEFKPKPRFDVSTLLTFEIGHALHEAVQKALAKMYGSKFREEVRVDLPEAFVSGSSADGVIELDNCRVLLEIKSIGSAFKSLASPKSEHRVQAGGIYATALDCPFVAYLYVEKAWPHNFKLFVEPYDTEIYSWWWKKKGSWVEKALWLDDPPLADSTKWECVDCKYSEYCTQYIDPKQNKQFK